MKASEVMSFLENIFPLHLQMSFDNCGIQVGSKDANINKILVSLNLDEDVIDKAIELKCNMIISHHPLTIQAIKSFEKSNSAVKIIEKAFKNDILIYSLHTCLDQGTNGISMNDWLINLFDCHSIENYDELKIGKKAILNNEMKLSDFLEIIKKKLDIKHLKFTGDLNKTIKSFAICGGSASDDVYHLNDVVDAYITGDCKYHQGQFAKFNEIALIDVGHHIEVIVETKLKEMLSNFDVDVELASCKDYFEYM